MTKKISHIYIKAPVSSSNVQWLQLLDTLPFLKIIFVFQFHWSKFVTFCVTNEKGNWIVISYTCVKKSEPKIILKPPNVTAS